jgi:hypothetical protein
MIVHHRLKPLKRPKAPKPAPAIACGIVVSARKHGRYKRTAEPLTLTDDPEADERVWAFFVRMGLTVKASGG